MKVGLFLTNEHEAPADLAARLPDQLRLAAQAAEGGWDSIFTGQHFVTSGTQRLQPIPFLARLSAEVPGMTLGTGVHLWSLGNPVSMVEDFATLDVLTGGRVVAGLGLGYRQEEFDAFGVERRTRARRFERNLQIARGLWSGEAVTCDEPWCRLDGAVIGTAPVQKRLPVWIGGTSTAAVKRAGRLAEGWIVNPAAPASTLVDQAADYRRESEAAGNGPGWIAAFREIFCAPTQAQAEDLAMPYLERKYGTYAAWGQQDGHPDDQPLTGETADVANDRFIVGDPQTCREQLRAVRDTVGVDEFILRTDWPEMPAASAQSSLNLLIREVVPEL